jgi:2-keto-4-pentenoate hydratase/2-oxohepta-3-ene-1,7-dioic acid hydratase in catechol pathway
MMVIGRFKHSHKEFHGEVIDNKVHSHMGGREYSMDEVKVLPPCKPTKIVCVGLNYRDHAEEMKDRIPAEPVLFIKPPSSVIGHGYNIIYPKQSSRVDYEAELGVVINKRAKDIRPGHGKDYILGYTCFNDVTARDLQKIDVQWTRAKSFDTFSPVGPFIVTGIDPGNLSIKSKLNGEVKQSSNTNNMIFDVFKLVEFISGVMTLEPGDVIATGTPSGIGPMNKGDVIEIEVEKVGTLSNKVI